MQILQVFNRYLQPGGEEKSVDRICRHLSAHHQVSRCLFDSGDWQGRGVAGALKQARLLFGNPKSENLLQCCIETERPRVALFHNIYPVGSPTLYRRAQTARLPVIQYLHNFRPFSVSGTLYAKGRILADSLSGHFGPEVRHGSWQGSVIKSALFALMLKRLHRSGWLRVVRKWIAISDFMRERLIERGFSPDSIHTLRHAWDPMPQTPPAEDAGFYLFLGRLVEEKGVLPLLEAWRELERLLGRQTPVLKIAGDGPLASQANQAAAENPHVEMLGHVNGQAKEDLLRRCRAVVAPSLWWEPLGIVVYEAYDHAKPMLAARAGGLGETVSHGRTGLLHEPGAAGEILRDVRALEAMSADERAALGRNGRDWLLREASPERWRQSFDEILNEAVAPA